MKDFFDFQDNLVTTVVANAVAWGLPPTEVAALQGGNAAFVPVYNAAKNKVNRTPMQLLAYKAAHAEYVAFIRSFVQGFLVNNFTIPINDRAGMGLNPRGLSPRQPKEKITTAPIVALKALGGALVSFNFKVDAASKIGKMHPDSNGIAIYYRYVDIGGPTPPPPSMASGLGTPVGDETTNADNGIPTVEGYDLLVSTKAKFTRLMDLSQIGKVLHVYAQWVNSSKPQNNGNFSMVSIVVIS